MAEHLEQPRDADRFTLKDAFALTTAVAVSLALLRLPRTGVFADVDPLTLLPWTLAACVGFTGTLLAYVVRPHQPHPPGDLLLPVNAVTATCVFAAGSISTLPFAVFLTAFVSGMAVVTLTSRVLARTKSGLRWTHWLGICTSLPILSVFLFFIGIVAISLLTSLVAPFLPATG